MDSIITFIIGIVFIVIGLINRKGNVSMLHSYHIKRVKEEDKLPLGKKVGLGMLILGTSMILMGALSFIAKLSQQDIFLNIGTFVLTIGLVVGSGICLYAINKYNKGIF